jgi:hypothetical protein
MPNSWTCNWHSLGPVATCWTELFLGERGLLQLRPEQQLTDHEAWVGLVVPGQAEPQHVKILDCEPGQRLVLAAYVGEEQAGRLTFTFEPSGLTTSVTVLHEWSREDLWHMPLSQPWWSMLYDRRLAPEQADLELADQEIL